MTAPVTPVAQFAGWIIKCHRVSCATMAWLPKQPTRVVEKPKLVGELSTLLPKGWVATYWDFNQTRILGPTEECVAARPHYFCSEVCQQAGCGETTSPPDDVLSGLAASIGVMNCAAWASTVEVSHEVAAQIADSAVKQERTEVDALLAKRLEECFCTDDNGPCDDCVEVARIRGTLAGRSES